MLLLLAGGLYLILATQLRDDSEAQLRRRASIVTSALGQRTLTQLPAYDPSLPLPVVLAVKDFQPGLLVGGPFSGTNAIVIGPSGLPVGLPVPDQAGLAEARAGGTVIDEVTTLDLPLRVLSVPISQGTTTGVLQVVIDRTTELRTLGTALLVLTAGGVLVVLAAAVAGWVWAGRALVPIRDALRRQREFAADASHELRTPLAVIRGNVVALLRSTSLDAQDQGSVADIDEEAMRMTSLVDQLLLLARTDSGADELARVPTDLAEAAADAVDELSAFALGRRVRVELHVATTLVVGDPARLRQLATVLVDNAIRHAPEGGHAWVRVTTEHRIGRLVVEDDGAGVRIEDRERVFQRFWRARDAPHGGTGLGLAIAAWITERHDGRIWVEDRPDGGARFVVDLPSTDPEP